MINIPASAIVRRGTSALVMLLLAAELLPSEAQAIDAPTYWSSGYPLATGSSLMGPPVLVRGPDGDVTVLWNDGNVTAKRWSATGGWDAPARVGAATRPYGWLAAGADHNGNITAAWFGTENGSAILFSAQLVDRGSWSEPVRLVEPTTGWVGAPRLTVGPDGHAWVVWKESDSGWWPGCECLRAVSFAPGLGWSSPEVLSDARSAVSAEPTIAALPGSRALVAWLEGDENGSRVRTVLGDADGRWVNVTDAWNTGPGAMLNPVLHSRGALGALLVWHEFAGPRWGLRARLISPSLDWSAPVNISAGNVEGRFAVAFSTDDEGTTFASWGEQEGPVPSMKVRSLRATGEWDAPTTLTSGREVYTIEAAVAAGQGPAVAMWVESDGTTWAYYWSLRERNETWAAPVRGWSCPYGCGYFTRSYLSLAATPGGALAVWVQEDYGGNRTLTFATLAYRDTTPPALSLDQPERSDSEGPTFLVSGRTEPGASVVVAGVVAAVDANGSFGVSVALQRGVQRVVVTATDPAGNVATQSLDVNYGGMETTLTDLSPTIAAASLAAFLSMAIMYRRKVRSLDPPKEGRHRHT